MVIVFEKKKKRIVSIWYVGFGTLMLKYLYKFYDFIQMISIAPFRFILYVH